VNRFQRSFRSYDVDFSIISNDEKILISACEVAGSALLGNIEPIDRAAEHQLVLEKQRGGVRFSMNGEDYGVSPWSNLAFFFNTCVRLLIAEYTVDRVFLHAGVVVWNGRSILFPGDSNSGKTTLVAEFLLRGATYYSDEYAILDDDGSVHPFPRPLSIRDRTNFSVRREKPAESFGSVSGHEPIPVDYVFLLKYKKFSRFVPREMSSGEAIMRLTQQAIPLRVNPKFTLLVLNKVCERASVMTSNRGNVNFVVDKIIDLIDKTVL